MEKDSNKTKIEYYNFRGKDICPIDKEDKNKVILVAVAKKEEQYLNDWIKHYKKLGFEKIYIGDNNDIGDNSIYENIKNYIEEGFVQIIDLRGEKAFQEEFYTMFTLIGNYKWCAFFDIDEYLELNAYDDIKAFLKEKEEKDCVMFNWIMYGNNNIILNDKEVSVEERFKFPLPLNSILNMTIKSIVNGKCKKPFAVHRFKRDGHFQEYVGRKEGYIKHYKYRSIEEQFNDFGKTRPESPGTKGRTYKTFDNFYHEKFINCEYETWSFDILHCEKKSLKDIKVIYIKVFHNEDIVILNETIPLMLQEKDKIFAIESKNGTIADYTFDILLEYALHTGNKVCIGLPTLKEPYKYISYDFTTC